MEVHGSNNYDTSNSKNMIDMVTKDNKAIYLLLDSEDIPIGFIITYINNQYNMTTPYIVVEYMYITPLHRSGKAVMYLYTMVGAIVEDNELDVICSTYHTSSNIGNLNLVGGVPIATTYHIDQDTVINKYNKYRKRLR